MARTLAEDLAGTGLSPASASLIELAIGGAESESIPASEKGAPNGVATLDGAGKIDTTQIPFGGLGDPSGPIDGNGKLPVSQIPAPSTFGAVSSVATASIVYGTNGAGAQAEYAIGQTSAQPNTVVQRDSSAAIQTGAATVPGHATPKGYVDGLDATNVKLTGAQTVAGVKTFSASPIVPVPTTATQASTKGYVDGLDAANVKLTGAQTVAGVKTFSSSPIVPTPTTDTQAAPKGYVDLLSLIQPNNQSAAYTLVLADGGKMISHPAADTTARIWTIPANASVAFPVGTVVTFDNEFGAGAITIVITTDTMELVGAAGSTGNRTLATGGRATAIKVAATKWRISGQELT